MTCAYEVLSDSEKRSEYDRSQSFANSMDTTFSSWSPGESVLIEELEKVRAQILEVQEALKDVRSAAIKAAEEKWTAEDAKVWRDRIKSTVRALMFVKRQEIKLEMKLKMTSRNEDIGSKGKGGKSGGKSGGSSSGGKEKKEDKEDKEEKETPAAASKDTEEPKEEPATKEVDGADAAEENKEVPLEADEEMADNEADETMADNEQDAQENEFRAFILTGTWEAVCELFEDVRDTVSGFL